MIRQFGTIDGEQIDEIFLDNGRISCSVITYGCILRTLNVPDKTGKMIDVVLGYDRIEDYASNSGRMGAVIGRFANRIANAQFSIENDVYNLQQIAERITSMGATRASIKRSGT